MTGIIKKELISYYKGLSGWLFDAVFLFFTGLYMVMVNLNMAWPNFEYTLNNAAFVYIIMIPILTMRSFADESRQKTDKLLYVLPVKMSQIVTGKYIALLIVLLVPTLIMCAYPLFLLHLGASSLKAAYASILGFFLLGAVLISVGLFLSTLTDNPAIAAGCSFAVFLLIYFSSDLAEYLPSAARASFYAFAVCFLLIAAVTWLITGSIAVTLVPFLTAAAVLCFGYIRNPAAFIDLFPEVVRGGALFRRYYEFANAVLDLRTVVYYLTIIPVFLYLSELSLERKRWHS